MATWLYAFTENTEFPDPLAEISFLGRLDDEGGRAALLLAERTKDDPPMKGAQPGDRVVLCTRARGRLEKHGSATVGASASKEQVTPSDVLPLYGQLQNRWFVFLDGVDLHSAAPVGELEESERDGFLTGQAYVKKIGDVPNSHGQVAAAAPPPEVHVVAPSLPRLPDDGVLVMGLDPTAGLWTDKMASGPKPMPSVALVVTQSDGGSRIALAPDGVRWHMRNSEFLDRIREIEAKTVCIDGPCATNGLVLKPDLTGWDLSVPGGTREAERLLARRGVGLFWTTFATVKSFDGASRWIARSLKLFEEAQQLGVNAVETHPHGTFMFLRDQLANGVSLPKKSTPEGRAIRLRLLEGIIGGLDDAALKNHDAVDAAAAALIAALHVTGCTESFGTTGDGGVIHMPRFPGGRRRVD